MSEQKKKRANTDRLKEIDPQDFMSREQELQDQQNDLKLGSNLNRPNKGYKNYPKHKR